MTDKEKAKAYDEALKQAKFYHGNCPSEPERKKLEGMFPELRESEDERIRKEIVTYLRNELNNVTQLTPRTNECERWIAYLEKQKEQKHYWKPTETDVALFNKAVTTNKALTPAERAQLDIIRSKFSCCRAVNCNGIVQKEQKPEEKPINWTELTWKDINELEGIINNVHYEFRNGIGQESFGKEVLEKFREYKGDEYLDEIEQKPAEWSEEDEKRIQRIYDFLWKNRKGDTDTIYQIEKDAEWLKSLRPQPKVELTLLDENIIEAAVAFVEQNNHFNVWRGIDKHTVLKALRSLKPHWKPSGEQIQGLAHAINLDVYDAQRYKLDILYNDLKKLM